MLSVLGVGNPHSPFLGRVASLTLPEDPKDEGEHAVTELSIIAEDARSQRDTTRVEWGRVRVSLVVWC